MVVNIIEEFYGREEIYRAWILCGDDDEALELARQLDASHHTVACITMDDLENERPQYAVALHHFCTTARVLVTSYEAWFHLKEQIEVLVLPEQNLIMFGRLEREYTSYVERWLEDAAMRGFKSRCSQSFILHLYDEDGLASLDSSEASE